MSRRNGQNGTIVIAGNWYRVRWRMDVKGQERRVYMNEKVAPVVFDKNGTPKPPSVERTVCCSRPETALRICTIALNNDG